MPAAGRPLAFRHVVFDLDGTLVDSRADLAAAANHVRAGFGLPPLDPRTVGAFVGDGARALVERALGEAERARWDEGLRRFLVHYGAHLLDTTRAYPGVADTLAALHAAGAVLTVLTNKPQALSRRIVSGLGLARWIATTLGGDSLPTRKPDPAGVRLLVARHGIPAAATLLVGDSAIDQATAAAAAIAFCGVAWGFGPSRWQGAPAAVLAAPQDLLPLVERGFGETVGPARR